MRKPLTIAQSTMAPLRSNPGHVPFRTLRGEQGSLLLTLAILLTVLAVAGTAMIRFSATGGYTEVLANRHRAAYYAAESGGRYAIPQILADLDTAVADLNNHNFAYGDNSQFTLTIDQVSDPSAVLLTSSGVVNAGDWSEARADITYRFPLHAGEGSKIPYDFAVFGTDAVKISMGTHVGEYGVYPDFSNRILVATNADKITVTAAVVHGNTLTDAGLQFAPEVPILPTVFDTPLSLELPNKTLNYTTTDSIDLAPWNNRGQRNVTINAGTYQINSFAVHHSMILDLNGDIKLDVAGTFTVNFGTTVNINGNVVIYADDVFIHHSTKLNLAPGATLTIYFNNSFEFHHGSKINADGDSAKVMIYGTETAQQINYYMASTLNGVIYAPTAAAKVYMGGHINGALYASDVLVIMSSKILYGGPAGKATLSQPVQYFSQ